MRQYTIHWGDTHSVFQFQDYHLVTELDEISIIVFNFCYQLLKIIVLSLNLLFSVLHSGRFLSMSCNLL